jgi:hypothetical protein
MVAWLRGCVVAWFAWLHDCMVAWLHGCMVAWLHGFIVYSPGSIRWHAWQPAQQDSRAEVRSSL